MSHIQFFYIYGALYNKVGHILLKKPYVGLFGGVLAIMLSHGPRSVEGYHIYLAPLRCQGSDARKALVRVAIETEWVKI